MAEEEIEYVDADGNVLDPAEVARLDPSRFNFVEDTAPANFFQETGDRITSGFLSSIGNIVGGVGRSIAESPGLQFFTGYRPERLGITPQNTKRIRDVMLEQAAEIENRREMDTSTNWGVAQDFLSRGIGGVSKFLPGMALGPFGLPGQIGAEVYGADYSDLRDRGFSPIRSANVGAERAAINAAPISMLPRTWQRGGALTSGPRTALGLTMLGGLDAANRAATEQIALEGVPLDEFDLGRVGSETFTQVKDSAYDTAATGLLLGYGGAAGSRLARRPAETYQDLGELAPLDGPAADVNKAPEVTPDISPAPEVVPDKIDVDPPKPVVTKPLEIDLAEQTFPDPLNKREPIVIEAPKVVEPEPAPIGEVSTALPTIDSLSQRIDAAPLGETQTIQDSTGFLTFVKESDGSLFLPTLYAYPEHRGASIGSIGRLNQFLQAADSRGIPKITIEAVPDEGTSLDRLVRYYERVGFKRTGNASETAVEMIRENPEAGKSLVDDAASFRTPTKGEDILADSVRVPRDQIFVRPDVMQFRQQGAKDTGVTAEDRIDSPAWDDTKAGNLLLWEPLKPEEYGLPTGGKIVANGHHRIEYYDRSNAREIIPDGPNSQVLREADGWSAKDAYIKAAEDNIADGKGTIYDQAIFLRGLRDTQGSDVAEAIGSKVGRRGKDARTIGLDATDLIFKKFLREELPPHQTKLIAEAAPGNEPLQVAALELVKRAKNSLDLRNQLELLKDDPELFTALAKRNAETQAQGDLFGDSSGKITDAALQDVANQGELASEWQEYYQRQIKAAKGAALDPEVAKAQGVKVLSPKKALARIQELEADLKRWQGFGKDSELKQLLREGKKPPSLDTDESGMVRLDLLGGRIFEKAGEKLREHWLNVRYAPEQIDGIVAELTKKGVTIKARGQDLDPGELFLRGRIFGKHVPGASQAAEVVRKHWARPKLLAKKDPGFSALWENRKQQYEWEAQNTYRFAEKAAPFFDLLDQSKVAKALMSAREQGKKAFAQGKKLTVTPEKLKAAGLNDSEVKAFFSYREALNDAWKFAESEVLSHWQKRIDDPQKWAEKAAEIKEFFASKRDANYAPIQRYGDYFVYGKNKEGQEFYNLYKSRGAQREAAKNIAQRGFEFQIGMVRKPQNAAYENMPNDLAIGLNKLIQDPSWKPDVPTSGFKTHLLEAKLTEGYDQDARRNLAQYITSLTQWASKLRFDPQQKELLGKIDPRSPVYQEASDWLNYTNSAAKEGGKLRSILGHYYLGLLNPASATLNATQIFTVTYPELRRYTAKPWEALKQARQTYREYQKDPAAFAKRNPVIHDAIQTGIEQGMLHDEMARELFNVRKGQPANIKGRSWSDLSMLFNRIAERRNRVISFIAGYQNAPKGKDPVEFAKSFVEDTQFIYSRLNRPRIARGMAAPFYTFRLYGHNYWGNLKEAGFEMLDAIGKAKGATDAEMKAEYQRQAKALRGTLARYGASTAVLGGGAALPFVSVILAAAAANGIDLKKQLRDFVGNDTAADVMMYGPASQLFGVTLTGAVDPNNMIQIDKGPAATAEKLAFGVVSDLYRKPVKAAESYKTHGSILRAAEEVAPRTIRNVMQAARWAREGKATDIAGRTVMDKPTPFEIGAKALSFNPTRYVKSIEKSGATRIVGENAKAETEKLLQKIAVAAAAKDKERVKELLQYAAEIGYEVKPKALLERMAENANPDYRAYKSTPKRARSELAEVMRSYRDVE